MSQISLDRKISAAPNVMAQDLAGESVLLDMQSEQYFGLDDVEYEGFVLNDTQDVRDRFSMFDSV